MIQPRVDQDPPEAVGPDPPRADMLVPVLAGSELGARVVQVDHPQPAQAESPVELRQQFVHPGGRVDRVAGTPGMSGVEAVPEPRGIDAGRGHGVVDPLKLLERSAQPVAPARAVLDHENGTGYGRSGACRRWPGRRAIGLGGLGPRSIGLQQRQRLPYAVREAIDADLDARTPVRAGVHVHESRPVRRRHAELVGQDRHRALVELRLRPREVHEVRSVDGKGRQVVCRDAVPERRELVGKSGAAPPGRRVVAEHLERGCADRGGAVRCPDHAAAERQVGTEAPAVREHRSKTSPREGFSRAAKRIAPLLRRSRPSWTQSRPGPHEPTQGGSDRRPPPRPRAIREPEASAPSRRSCGWGCNRHPEPAR